MKHQLNRMLDVYMVLAVFLGAIVLTGIYAVPVSYWLTVDYVRVGDITYGEPVMIDFQRETHRTFMGHYSVSIKEIGDGNALCWSGADAQYAPGEDGSGTKTLEWWSYGLPNPCTSKMLTAGDYVLKTCWTVKRPFAVLPPKHWCIESNVFEVKPQSVAQDYLLKQQEALTRQVDRLQKQLEGKQ